MKNVAENLKKLRLAKNLTQTELAERVGMTKATISAYENGTRLPSYDVLIKLAHQFKVTTDNLLGFSNKYVIDVSHLTPRQRNVVQEIAMLYRAQNRAGDELADSDSAHREKIAMGLVNEFEIEDNGK